MVSTCKDEGSYYHLQGGCTSHSCTFVGLREALLEKVMPAVGLEGETELSKLKSHRQMVRVQGKGGEKQRERCQNSRS